MFSSLKCSWQFPKLQNDNRLADKKRICGSILSMHMLHLLPWESGVTTVSYTREVLNNLITKQH